MFPKNLVQKAANVDIAVSDRMSKAIDLWDRIYMNQAPWLIVEEPNKPNKESLNLGAVIAGEIARLVTVEFKSEIINNDFLQEQYKNVLDDLRKYVEYGCAKGGLVFKPYIDGNSIAVDYVQADKIFPVAYNSKGEITSAVFVEQKRIGKKLYSRLEYHDLQGTDYTITNKAYCNNNAWGGNDKLYELGQEVELSAIDEWASLSPVTILGNIDKPLFAYFKVPQANTEDTSSPLGVSVFSRAVDLIKQADEQWNRILWEFEGSELAIDASSDCFKRDEAGNYILPKGKERLFRAHDFGANETSKAIETFSPSIRDTSLFNGLDNILKRIEFNCNLSYGTISDPQSVDKTATEVISSKQREYSNIKDTQISLQNALEHLVYAMSVLGSIYGLCNTNYEISYNWDDSIVVDKEKELASMQADVAAGILRPELYIMKKYGVTEEEALKMMPQSTNDSDVDDDIDGDE